MPSGAGWCSWPEGKSAKTVSEFADHLVRHGGDPYQVVQALPCCGASATASVRDPYSKDETDIAGAQIHVR